MSKTIREFFNARYFEIPKYQRGYAWELQNVCDLFDDIAEAVESNSNHYIGTFVLSKKENADGTFFVVDGQQRITTITMILKAIVERLSESDKIFYERFYIYDQKKYRLTPLNRDKDFFLSMLEGKSEEAQNKSQRVMREAMKEIKLRLGTISDRQKFLEAIEKLEVMEFVENSEGDAIRIFQTVNDRGKPLSNMEKSKSLLIYFSNKYLKRKLDDKISDTFSDIFELYDDIKQCGENLNITLFKNKEYNEDNIMRYHFIAFFEDNYDPTPDYILKHLKAKLKDFVKENKNCELEEFISHYIETLKIFFKSLKAILQKSYENEFYYKVFSVLQLSATLYPLAIKLESLGILDEKIFAKEKQTSILKLLELIDVRVYKTRGTDPKADIARFTYSLQEKTPKEIGEWLLWYNECWMSKEQFVVNLNSNIYGNRALDYIFANYCECLSQKKFSISELKNISALSANIEHIVPQTLNCALESLGFENEEDYENFVHRLGNLTLLETKYNSSVQNKVPAEKTDAYAKSFFIATNKIGAEISAKNSFKKQDIIERTKILAEYASEAWWC